MYTFCLIDKCIKGCCFALFKKFQSQLEIINSQVLQQWPQLRVNNRNYREVTNWFGMRATYHFNYFKLFQLLPFFLLIKGIQDQFQYMIFEELQSEASAEVFQIRTN